MSVKVKVKLDKQLVRSITKSGSKRATWMALDHLASVSKQQVPLDQGPLKNSCAVDVNDDGSQGTVSYDTPYAVVQHENTWYRHQRGRKAKYLEDPAFDSSVQKEMAQLAQQGFSAEME
jgi:hypothetical protein